MLAKRIGSIQQSDKRGEQRRGRFAKGLTSVKRVSIGIWSRASRSNFLLCVYVQVEGRPQR